MSEQASAPSCSLEGRNFNERVAWIAALNDRHLRGHRRDGSTLILTYAAEARREVEELIAREQECCAFLDFGLRTANGAVALTITVPRGQEADADRLLAPFHDSRAGTDTPPCCSAC